MHNWTVTHDNHPITVLISQSSYLQVSLLEFYAGLRARNWTARPYFDANAVPWRVQLFRCAYQVCVCVYLCLYLRLFLHSCVRVHAYVSVYACMQAAPHYNSSISSLISCVSACVL